MLKTTAISKEKFKLLNFRRLPTLLKGHWPTFFFAFGCFYYFLKSFIFTKDHLIRAQQHQCINFVAFCGADSYRDMMTYGRYCLLRLRWTLVQTNHSGRSLEVRFNEVWPCCDFSAAANTSLLTPLLSTLPCPLNFRLKLKKKTRPQKEKLIKTNAPKWQQSTKTSGHGNKRGAKNKKKERSSEEERWNAIATNITFCRIAVAIALFVAFPTRFVTVKVYFNADCWSKQLWQISQKLHNYHSNFFFFFGGGGVVHKTHQKILKLFFEVSLTIAHFAWNCSSKNLLSVWSVECPLESSFRVEHYFLDDRYETEVIFVQR